MTGLCEVVDECGHSVRGQAAGTLHARADVGFRFLEIQPLSGVKGLFGAANAGVGRLQAAPFEYYRFTGAQSYRDHDSPAGVGAEA